MKAETGKATKTLVELLEKLTTAVEEKNSEAVDAVMHELTGKTVVNENDDDVYSGPKLSITKSKEALEVITKGVVGNADIGSFATTRMAQALLKMFDISKIDSEENNFFKGYANVITSISGHDENSVFVTSILESLNKELDLGKLGNQIAPIITHIVKNGQDIDGFIESLTEKLLESFGVRVSEEGDVETVVKILSAIVGRSKTQNPAPPIVVKIVKALQDMMNDPLCKRRDFVACAMYDIVLNIQNLAPFTVEQELKVFMRILENDIERNESISVNEIATVITIITNETATKTTNDVSLFLDYAEEKLINESNEATILNIALAINTMVVNAKVKTVDGLSSDFLFRDPVYKMKSNTSFFATKKMAKILASIISKASKEEYSDTIVYVGRTVAKVFKNKEEVSLFAKEMNEIVDSAITNGDVDIMGNIAEIMLVVTDGGLNFKSESFFKAEYFANNSFMQSELVEVLDKIVNGVVKKGDAAATLRVLKATLGIINNSEDVGNILTPKLVKSLLSAACNLEGDDSVDIVSSVISGIYSHAQPSAMEGVAGELIAIAENATKKGLVRPICNAVSAIATFFESYDIEDSISGKMAETLVSSALKVKAVDLEEEVTAKQLIRIIDCGKDISKKMIKALAEAGKNTTFADDTFYTSFVIAQIADEILNTELLATKEMAEALVEMSDKAIDSKNSGQILAIMVAIDSIVTKSEDIRTLVTPKMVASFLAIAEAIENSAQDAVICRSITSIIKSKPDSNISNANYFTTSEVEKLLTKLANRAADRGNEQEIVNVVKTIALIVKNSDDSSSLATEEMAEALTKMAKKIFSLRNVASTREFLGSISEIAVGNKAVLGENMIGDLVWIVSLVAKFNSASCMKISEQALLSLYEITSDVSERPSISTEEKMVAALINVLSREDTNRESLAEIVINLSSNNKKLRALLAEEKEVKELLVQEIEVAADKNNTDLIYKAAPIMVEIFGDQEADEDAVRITNALTQVTVNAENSTWIKEFNKSVKDIITSTTPDKDDNANNLRIAISEVLRIINSKTCDNIFPPAGAELLVQNLIHADNNFDQKNISDLIQKLLRSNNSKVNECFITEKVRDSLLNEELLDNPNIQGAIDSIKASSYDAKINFSKEPIRSELVLLKTAASKYQDGSTASIQLLIYRFLDESSKLIENTPDKDTKIAKLIQCIKPIITHLEEDKTFFKAADEIARIFQGGCVNQPLSGALVIGALTKIYQAKTPKDKLKAADDFVLVEQVREFVLAIIKDKTRQSPGRGVEIEAGNRMTQLVNDNLILDPEAKNINDPLIGMPRDIPYVGTVEKWATKQLQEEASAGVKNTLNDPLAKAIKLKSTEFAAILAEVLFEDKDLANINEQITLLQTIYAEVDAFDPSSKDDEEEEEVCVTKLISPEKWSEKGASTLAKLSNFSDEEKNSLEADINLLLSPDAKGEEVEDPKDEEVEDLKDELKGFLWPKMEELQTFKIDKISALFSSISSKTATEVNPNQAVEPTNTKPVQEVDPQTRSNP